MLSIDKCKKVLNKGDKKFTDEEVKKIRQFLYELAEIQYIHSKSDKTNDGNSSDILKGINRRPKGKRL